MEPTQLLIHTGAAPDQGASGKPRRATSIGSVALLLRMPLRKHRLTTIPQPPWATLHKPATLPGTLRKLKPKFLIPTAEDSVKRLNPLLSGLKVDIKTSNLENAKCGNISLPDHLNLPLELREKAKVKDVPWETKTGPAVSRMKRKI